MTKVDISELGFEKDNSKVVSFETKQEGFRSHVNMIKKLLPSVNASTRIATLINRERIKTQVTFTTAKGETFALDDLALMKLPIPVSRKVLQALDDNTGPAPTIVKQGDGVTTPILLQLGTPIKFSKGEDITELEFHCQYYGEIEDVLAEDLNMAQAVLLIEKAAKPVGSTLQALPDSALDQITVSDGAFITGMILPRFLG